MDESNYNENSEYVPLLRLPRNLKPMTLFSLPAMEPLYSQSREYIDRMREIRRRAACEDKAEETIDDRLD